MIKASPSALGTFGMLPESLKTLIANCIWTEVTLGESSASVHRLQHADGRISYLKTAPMSVGIELYDEKERLDWLRGKLPVPDVVFSGSDDTNFYLLLSAIPGVDAASLSTNMDSSTLVRLLAQGLRIIHRLPIEECPFDKSLVRDIEVAQLNVSRGLVDEANFDEARQGRSAHDLFKELLFRKPIQEDLVFTHGDYSLPNIIIEGNRIAGFVDLGRAGVSDRYKYLALAVRSIRDHDSDLEPLFFDEYGVFTPEFEKIEFYMLLDEFF